MTTTGLRDYNIVTGRYLELNDAKQKVDQEIQRAEAAQKYWDKHDFDHLTCTYFDPNKETEYLEYALQYQYLLGNGLRIRKFMAKTKSRSYLSRSRSKPPRSH